MPSELHELLYYIEAQDEDKAAGKAPTTLTTSEVSGRFPVVGNARDIRAGARELHRHSRSETPTPSDAETVQ